MNIIVFIPEENVLKARNTVKYIRITRNINETMLICDAYSPKNMGNLMRFTNIF